MASRGCGLPVPLDELRQAPLVRSGRQAVNVEGGMSAWMRAGLPVVTRHGGPGGSSSRKRFPRYPD